MNNKLYVGNLSFDTTESGLHDAFGAYGSVVEATLIMDKMSGRSRGFGFVTMSTPEEAEAAINGLNEASLDGRNIIVNIARPKEDRPGGGGGGGGARRGGPRREFGGRGNGGGGGRRY